jgi:ribosomal protein S18 acetylase RimI-like enzyme
MIRPARSTDISAVANLVIAAKMFERSDEWFLKELFNDFFESKIAEGHAFLVDLDDEDAPQAMAYYQPKAATDRVWDLTMIAVHPDRQGHGLGGNLMRHVEEDLRGRGQRLLIVETSATEQFDLTRDFYVKQGYEEEARVRDYWEDSDDLVLFRKRLAPLAPA